MRIGIYVADQAWSRTLSKGIYSYSRQLVRELLERLPEHDWVVFVNRWNRREMLPAGDLRGVTVVELPGSVCHGVGRLVGDQVVAPLMARRYRLDVLHFPKGYVPWLGPAGTFTATMHDTIPVVYGIRYPGHFSRVKLAYLKSTLIRGLRSCRAIVTDSDFSRGELVRLAEEARVAVPMIGVCSPSPDPALWRCDGAACPPRVRQLIHFGSRLPHKRTRETLRLFNGWNARQGGGWRLRVVGLAGPPAGWNSVGLDSIDFLGELAVDVLRWELQRARALLLLSEVEGFGLPALEAWFLGTPVCYTSGGALAEVLGGAPGHCAVMDDENFGKAMDELLSLTDARRAVIEEGLRAQFGPEAFGVSMAAQVRKWLGMTPGYGEGGGGVGVGG